MVSDQSGSEESPNHSRRSYLGLVGGIIAAGSVVSQPVMATATTVDLGEQGLTTGELIDPYLEEAFVDGVTVQIPAGSYEWAGGGFEGASENAAVVGQGDVSLELTGDSFRNNIRAESGTVELRNLTVRGKPSDKSPFRLETSEAATIIVDTGGLRDDAQRAITLVVLSQLWAALRRRAARGEDENDHPLVNCYIEEAATVADTGLLSELLSQSRSFGLSITLAMQFPRQLQAASQRAYDEVLNDVGTILTGPVRYDPQLAERLATDAVDDTAMAARMRGLRPGQWLASLPAPFGETPPQPCLLASPTPPRGHPASDDSLDRTEQVLYEAAATRCRHRTVEEAGLPIDTTQRYTADGESTDSVDVRDDDARRPRVDTPLPYTTRFPSGLRYEAELSAIVCEHCEAAYDAGAEGMRRALECHPNGSTNPDDVPITELTLKLSPNERHDTDYTDAQLMFLQAVYNAQQGRYQAPEFDLVFDSMLRLQEYVGIESEAVDELLDDGLLNHGGNHPHRLYTVTSDGRRVLNEGHRRGIAFGHGTGDLGESSQHTLGVEAGRRYLETHYRQDSDSPVVEVVPYYEPDHDAAEPSGNADRLDVVGLDSEGAVVVAIEVERINNDLAEAAPADYDKMAACEPDEAIWITMTQSDGHKLVRALNDPLDGEPRVTKTYAETTPLQQFRIDTPGFTGIYPLTWIRDRTEEE